MLRRIGCLVAAVAATFVWTGSASAALGGPVILGGDDFTHHGSVQRSSGELRGGWLYLQRALENVSPKVVRPGVTPTVAALGSASSSATTEDAGAAIGWAAAKAGLGVTYYEGASAIDGFFAALAAGGTNPRIVWIAGDGSENDIDSSEAAALSANATRIADFVNSGGGLVSHGSEYGWLSALLPGLSARCCGTTDGDLYLTSAGAAAFPGVGVEHVNGGPWHNYFEGDLGGLDVLVRSSSRKDSRTGQDAAVIIGGASVVLPGAISLSPPSSTGPPGATHTVTATVKQASGAPVAGAVVTFSITSGANAGKTGSAVSNASGEASFSYKSNGAVGTDTIEASFVDATNATRSVTATRIWAVSGAKPPGQQQQPPRQQGQIGCALTTATRSVFAGVRSIIAVRTRYNDGSARADVPVTLRGLGKPRTARTNVQGVARFTALPKQVGRITVAGAGCGAEVRVAVLKARSCAGLKVTVRKLKARKLARFSVRLRIAGKPAVGVLVRFKGPGVATSTRTNAAGIATIRGKPRAGVHTVSAPAVLTCSKRIRLTRGFLRW